MGGEVLPLFTDLLPKKMSKKDELLAGVVSWTFEAKFYLSIQQKIIVLEIMFP